MVGVMGAVGDRTGISGFYISFVLAPLASNASELIAAFNYSLKKTSRTIVISFAALQVRSGVSPSTYNGLGLPPFSQYVPLPCVLVVRGFAIPLRAVFFSKEKYAMG